MSHCNEIDNVGSVTYHAWISNWSTGSHILSDQLSMAWGYNTVYVAGISLTHTVGVLTPTWTRDLMDEDPEYGPNEPPSNCPNMALSWSYSGALRFCPGGGVNSTRIGVPAPWRMIVRGFYDGYSNGDEPEFITNSNGTSPCPVITTEFWGPGQLT